MGCGNMGIPHCGSLPPPIHSHRRIIHCEANIPQPTSRQGNMSQEFYQASLTNERVMPLSQATSICVSREEEIVLSSKF